jgi:hypothetical protein
MAWSVYATKSGITIVDGNRDVAEVFEASAGVGRSQAMYHAALMAAAPDLFRACEVVSDSEGVPEHVRELVRVAMRRAFP